jgi:hypothetical protein
MEREWKDRMKIVYEDNDCRRTHLRARMQSSYRRFLITKKNKIVKMLARAEVTMTKGQMVRDRSHEATVQFWDVVSERLYMGAGVVIALKPTLTDEEKTKVLATIGLTTKDLEPEDLINLDARMNAEGNIGEKNARNIGEVREANEPVGGNLVSEVETQEPPIRITWEAELKKDLHIARTKAFWERIMKLVMEEMPLEGRDNTPKESNQ